MLVALGGCWSHATVAGNSNRRFLFFLFITGDGLLLAEYLIGLASSEGSQLLWQATSLSMPTGVTLLALLITRIKTLRSASRRLKILAVILGTVNLALLALIWSQPYGWAQIIAAGALLLAITWTISNRWQPFAIFLSLACLAGLAVLNAGDIPAPLGNENNLEPDGSLFSCACPDWPGRARVVIYRSQPSA